MSKSYIDTTKLNNDYIEFNETVANLERVLTNYYTKMAKVPTETLEWQGVAAKEFVSILDLDYKKDVIGLIKNLKQYANELNTEIENFGNVDRVHELNENDIL